MSGGLGIFGARLGGEGIGRAQSPVIDLDTERSSLCCLPGKVNDGIIFRDQGNYLG